MYIGNSADIETGQIAQVVDLGAISITGVQADGPIDWVTTDMGTYMLSGTQKRQITLKKVTTSIFNRREFTVWNNKFFGKYVGTGGIQHVMIIGAYHPGLPTQVATYNRFSTIGSMCAADNGVYVAGTCSINGVSKKGIFRVFFDENNSAVKCATGTLTTLYLYGHLAATIKKIEEFLIGHIFPAGCTITLKVYINESTTAQTIKAMSGTDFEGQPRTRIIANELSDTVSQERTRIKVEFLLTR